MRLLHVTPRCSSSLSPLRHRREQLALSNFPPSRPSHVHVHPYTAATMSSPPTPRRYTPIIIGVGDFKNQAHASPKDGSDEPAALMAQAVTLALADTWLSGEALSRLRGSVDSVAVVRPWSWPYADAAAHVSKLLALSPSQTHVSPHGGNQPAKLVDAACSRIASGAARAAVVCGGEALDSLRRYVKRGTVPPPGWSEVEPEALARGASALRPPSEEDRENGRVSVKGAHAVGAPIQVYPMYENGLRAREGKGFAEAHAESARMYAEFARVSAANEHSWNFGRASSEEEIATVGPKNRMICLPYPLLMNAFNDVNVAAACVLTSAEFARELGIPEAKWVYVLGGAGTAESEEFYMRANYHSSPAIERSVDAALDASGVGRDQIDLYDLYSCFPVVPKLACRHLGLPTSRPPRPITLLGGLTSFGGAGNNYSMHAISEMSRQLRQHRGRNGLVLANGGVLSYQHALVLSSGPGRNAYPDKAPLPERLDELPASEFEQAPEGDAVIETYTVDFGRDGKPRRGHVIGRLAENNHRFVANHADEQTLSQLSDTSRDVIGRKGRVYRNAKKEGQNLFTLLPATKL